MQLPKKWIIKESHSYFRLLPSLGWISFSRSHGPIFPTSLTYIVLSTRGCSPRRPAAVMSMTGNENHCLPRIFKGRRRRTGHHKKCGALPGIKPYIRTIRFQGESLLKRKENSSRGPGVSAFTCVAAFATHEEWQYPCSGSAILTRFPFDRRPKIGHFDTEFPYLLGSSNPCPTAVHMEPFSTSVFKVLIWIFATTTKICTRGRFTQACAKACIKTTAPSYPSGPDTHPDGEL